MYRHLQASIAVERTSDKENKGGRRRELNVPGLHALESSGVIKRNGLDRDVIDMVCRVANVP